MTLKSRAFLWISLKWLQQQVASKNDDKTMNQIFQQCRQSIFSASLSHKLYHKIDIFAIEKHYKGKKSATIHNEHSNAV